MTTFRTPLAQVKAQGSAHKGTDHWRQQRISGMILVPLGIWFLLEILAHTQADYHAVLAWAAQPWIGAALALFVSFVFYHGILGLQVVIEDYVQSPFWQLTLIINVKILGLVMTVLSWFFIIRIAIIGNG